MKENTDSNWMSLSDIMTSLMVIFLFISISFMNQLQKKQKESNQIFEDFNHVRNDLFLDLNAEFEKDFKKWKVVLDKDLSIKFTNPDVLFQSGSTNIRPYFASILNQFLPRYFDIILQDKYINNISEIRIEGHTDNVPAPQYDTDPYIANILLSQRRSAKVVKHFRHTKYFKKLTKKQIKLIEYLLTANGLSYGRTLDRDGNLTINSKKRINNNKSRRVEFKIVTTSEKLINNVLKQINQ